MFEVHCDELIQALAKRAKDICNKLLARMSKDHLDANKMYVYVFFYLKCVEFLQRTDALAVHFDMANVCLFKIILQVCLV